MTLEQKIRMALAYRHVTQVAAARALGMSRQSFHRKLKSASFTIAELECLARFLHAGLETSFRFGDGI